MNEAIRVEDDGHVRHLVLCRPDEYNTITPGLRDELGLDLDDADRDGGVRVVLVRAQVGLILECVPDIELSSRASQLAQRMALLPLNQLQMLKWSLNDAARHQYAPDTSRLLDYLFDGVARHTQEGLDFVTRAQEIGWREAVRERDRPFGDYGERGHTTGSA